MKEMTDEEVGLTTSVQTSQPVQQQIPTPSEYLQGGAQTFMEGFTGGYGGELQNQMDAEMAALQDSGNPLFQSSPFLESIFGAPTQKTGNQLREMYAQQAGPIGATALEIGGTLANPVFRKAGSKYIAAHPFKGGFMQGTLMGGLFGSGKNEDNRVFGGLMNAALGGPLGGSSSWLLNALANRLIPSRAAERVVGGELRESFPDELAVKNVLDEIGPDARILDLTAGTRGLGIGSSVNSTKARDMISTFLTSRAKGAPGRILTSLKKSFGLKGKDFTEFVDNRITQAASEAKPLYDAAAKKTIPEASVQSFLNQIDDVMKTDQVSGHAKAIGLLRQLKRTMVKGDRVKTSVDGIDSARQAFGKNLFMAKSKLGKKVYDELVGIRDQFDSILPDEYVQANRIWSGDVKKAEEAFSLGKKIFTKDIDDMAREAHALPRAERDLLWAGIGKAISNKLSRTSKKGKPPAALNTQDIEDKLTRLFGEKTAKNYVSLLDTEDVYAATRNAIEGGSDTMYKIAASQKVTGKMAGQGIPVTTDEAVNLAVRSGIGKLFGGGTSERATNEIAKILIDDIGEEGLKKLMATPDAKLLRLAPLASALAGEKVKTAME